MRRCVECNNILTFGEQIVCDTCKKTILDRLEEQWFDGGITQPPSPLAESKLDTKKKQMPEEEPEEKGLLVGIVGT